MIKLKLTRQEVEILINALIRYQNDIEECIQNIEEYKTMRKEDYILLLKTFQDIIKKVQNLTRKINSL